MGYLKINPFNSTSATWGNHTVLFYLPGASVVIDGLSARQYRDIARKYAAFVSAGVETLQTADVVCRAGRLAQPVGLPIEHFLVNDQYALHKERSGSKIAVTGFDFVANITCDTSAPAHASLSVLKEDELATVGVLENFLRVLLSYRALARGGVLLHSAGILYRDRAYLFCGRSNAGKTTLARKAAAAGARVLSDDINLVIPENGAFRAHKVPFTGEFGRRMEKLSEISSFTLGGLVLLEKASTLTAVPVRPAEAVAGLLTGCPFVNDDPEESSVLLDILMNLVADAPIIRLGASIDDPFEAVMDTLLRHYEND